ncbi:MAG: response regulator [Planctomycetaceae bacterium]|nr:response regulator [Planctomycetaceae bacterium]
MSYHNARVLLIVSDSVTASITEFRLRLLGYHVELIDRGEGIAEATARQSPDLAIVELALPGMSGFEAIARLRRDVHPELPVIALSPDASHDSLRQASLAGAAEYVLMPFDPATMEQKIEQQLASASFVSFSAGGV